MVPGVIGYIPEYWGFTGTPRRLMGLMGPSGGRGEAAKGQPRAPPPKSELDKEGGGRRPPFLSPSLSFPLLSYSNKEGGSPTPGGSRTPHGAHQGWPAPPPPLLFYIWGQVAPHRHNN